MKTWGNIFVTDYEFARETQRDDKSIRGGGNEDGEISL